MTLQTSGAISFTDLKNEYGGSSTDIALGNYAAKQQSGDRQVFLIGWDGYSFKINGSKESNPFPLQFSAYGELNAHLFEPMEGNLFSGNVYNFSLEVNGISELSLIQNGKWTSFMKNGNSFIIKDLKLNSGAIQIAAKNKNSNKYTTILEYNVL